jgi:hypothetical protein
MTKDESGWWLVAGGWDDRPWVNIKQPFICHKGRLVCVSGILDDGPWTMDDSW